MTPLDEKPVTISLVGTGTGTGGGVSPIPNGTVVETPVGPALVKVVGPIVAIVVRFIHLFLVTFVGLITAAGIGVGTETVPLLTFHAVIGGSAVTSVVVAGVGLLKDLVTVFGRLEGKYPLWTGGI